MLSHIGTPRTHPNYLAVHLRFYTVLLSLGGSILNSRGLRNRYRTTRRFGQASCQDLDAILSHEQGVLWA